MKLPASWKIGEDTDEVTGEFTAVFTAEFTAEATGLAPDCAFAGEAKASNPQMHVSIANLIFEIPIFNSPSLVWVNYHFGTDVRAVPRYKQFPENRIGR